MTRRTLAGVVLCLPFLLAPTCMQQLLAPRIEFLDAWLYELSSDGSVAVGYEIGTSRGKIWRNGSLEELEYPVGLYPRGLSRDGGVIVGYGSPGAAWLVHPYRWDRAHGVLTDLSPATSSDGEASDVSASGDVVVGEVDGQGVLWVGGALVPLSTDAFLADSANSVSADGEVILGLGEDADGNSGRYLWRAGEITWLAGLPGAEDPMHRAYPYLSISGDGTTVVDIESFRPLGSPYGWLNQAFRWRNGVAEPLGSLEGAPQPFSNAHAVTDNGEVIAGQALGPDGSTWAVIWDATHGMRTLESLLLELGVEMTDNMRLEDVYDISGDGRRILGSAYTLAPHFLQEGTFIVTLPPACADYLDNNGDGQTDLREDDGCTSKFDASEEP